MCEYNEPSKSRLLQHPQTNGIKRQSEEALEDLLYDPFEYRELLKVEKRLILKW